MPAGGGERASLYAVILQTSIMTTSGKAASASAISFFIGFSLKGKRGRRLDAPPPF